MATETEFWGRPMEPGTVKIDPNTLVERARVVREALRLLATHAATHGDYRESAAFDALDVLGSDERLARLGRLLK